MKIYTNSHSAFPDQVVPDGEKATWEYGLRVGRAIEGEWFWAGQGRDKFYQNYNNFHQLRLYARGEQSIQKYKDELAIDGDLSYLNLDWKPVPILPKFVDIVVNGISQRTFDINAFAQDPVCARQRTEYAEGLLTDINAKSFLEQVEQSLGVNAFNAGDRDSAPQDEEELAVHLQMDFKQSVEVAEEEVINQVLDKNKYELTRARINYDLAVCGIGALKTTWNESEGIVVDYVDPAHLVWSYTEDPNFQDLWYVGEVKGISLSELKKEFPALTAAELEEIQKYPGNQNYIRNWNGRQDNNTIQVLYFEYKTYTNQVFKLKENAFGLEKILEKQDTFDPPADALGYGKLERSIETLYSGAKILGHPQMLRWELAKNMTRPIADTVKVNMNYAICAPRMYKGRINSLVNRVTGFADMIQLTHLKLQQVLARIVPDGVYLDVDGLAEVDLGNGTNYNPKEALNMYFQTGSVVGRSLTQDGDVNRGKIPIQELSSSNGMAKMQSLIQTYNYYLQMIRDVTGLNEARDASVPDKDSLVGLQKLAAANSNTATRHILQAGLFLTHRACENISLRVADSLMYPTTRQSLQNSLSNYNVGTLDELAELNIHDFGIFINLEPDEEEKAQLEQNIQIALKENQIYLEDAIDIREVKNLTLANQFLKYRRKKKQEQDQATQKEMIQAQAQANAEAAEKAAMAEVQKQQALAETEAQLKKVDMELSLQKMQVELNHKLKMAEVQHGYDLQLKQMDVSQAGVKEDKIEQRKDQRTRIQGTQQSQMIAQRTNDSAPVDFEKGGGPGQIPLTSEDFMAP
jgi:hypothetical protein